MLTLYQQPARRWNVPLVVSIVLHCVLLAGMLWRRAEPPLIMPSSVQYGNGMKSYRLVYLSPAGVDTGKPIPHTKQVSLAIPKAVAQAKRGKSARNRTATKVEDGEPSDRNVRAGMPYGSLWSGPTSGHDVRPALPVVFPDPPVSRSDIPAGVEGNVIVEVTIDDHGSIIDMRLLSGLGHGIDDRVMSTLWNWRYRPATMDGRPIASKHDVCFHYPA
jgi:TonB family protein